VAIPTTQVVKLTRLLEQKDQAIAEMTPYVRVAKSMPIESNGATNRFFGATGKPHGVANKPFGATTSGPKVAQASLRLTTQQSSKWRY